MMLRVGLSLCIIVLTCASAYNNFEHTKHLGLGLIALVIAAEMAKPLLPVAMLNHAQTGNLSGLVAAFSLWLLIIVFSCVNTLGNALNKHASEKSRIERNANAQARPEHIVLADIARLPACKSKTVWITKQKPIEQPDTACEESNARKKTALEAEAKRARDTQGTTAETAIDKYTAEDGYAAVAAMFGWYPKRYEIGVMITLIWMLLAEVGSGLGGLAIPKGKRP